MSRTAPPAPLTLREIDRAELADWLDRLSAWLLPGACYPVQHTWPQLYRRDGHGRSLGLFAGDDLVAHAAMRQVELVTDAGCRRAGLIGSVATAPACRGRGLASRLLHELIARGGGDGLDLLLLWAERPGLYARHGFAAGPRETVLALGAAPTPDPAVRLASFADRQALHALHEAKPWRVRRSAHEMSLLLSTPGMEVAVLERQGRVTAYACCGKGADFPGWWHELGGSDEDLARLLPAALTLTGQTAALVVVPPYRAGLADRLGESVLDRTEVDGPMLLPLGGTACPRFFVDGLDSI